jgi:hypothetical protein
MGKVKVTTGRVVLKQNKKMKNIFQKIESEKYFLISSIKHKIKRITITTNKQYTKYAVPYL